jgi:hypothetical protein
LDGDCAPRDRGSSQEPSDHRVDVSSWHRHLPNGSALSCAAPR